MNTKEHDISVYWANVCILKRLEADLMEQAAEDWSITHEQMPRMIYLGDTDEVKMYDQLKLDSATGQLGFDMLVSTRFDVFCSQSYLQGLPEQLFPVGTALPVRPEIEATGILGEHKLFYPTVVLPHYIVYNTAHLQGADPPGSLEELLDPIWDGKVVIGSPELPSGKFVLFVMWFLFGDAGLKRCLRQWRYGSAPSAARHAVVKGEYPVAVLPGVFSGPGPDDHIVGGVPTEGLPILPSFAAVRKTSHSEHVLEFLRASIGGPAMIDLYRNQALAYPTHPDFSPPDLSTEKAKMLFPDWEWILQQDLAKFDERCAELQPH